MASSIQRRQHVWLPPESIFPCSVGLSLFKLRRRAWKWVATSSAMALNASSACSSNRDATTSWPCAAVPTTNVETIILMLLPSSGGHAYILFCSRSCLLITHDLLSLTQQGRAISKSGPICLLDILQPHLFVALCCFTLHEKLVCLHPGV